MLESKKERLVRFGELHCNARINAGKSRDSIASELGVCKKTIQNWESGISAPSLFESIEWFRALNINPFPVYLSYLYPSTLEKKHKSTDEEIEKAFELLSQNLSTDVKRALLFVFCGNHGSDPVTIIQLALAHLHSPLENRLMTAESIITKYEFNVKIHRIVCPENILPNMKRVQAAFDNATKALRNKETHYTVL